RRLQGNIDNCTTAVGADPARRQAAVTEMRATWTAMKSEYPAEALKVLPPLWSCPMHSELMLSEAGTCPVCGMPLDPIYVTQPQLTQEPIIRAEIVAKAPLEVKNHHAEIYGYKFDLTFAKSLIHEKETVPGTLRVTAPDGQPFNQLEVVMGAFGHFVGFCDDFATVLHIHPVGSLIESPDL